MTKTSPSEKKTVNKLNSAKRQSSFPFSSSGHAYYHALPIHLAFRSSGRPEQGRFHHRDCYYYYDGHKLK